MSQAAQPPPTRDVSLPKSGGKRLLTGLGRAIRRKCPYCGGGGIFDGWFTLKQHCPHCQVRYANEDGYFLGSYIVNIGVTEVLTVLIVIWMIVGGAMSVLEMQIYGASLAIALPIFFYPFALLIWIAIDITFHDPATRKQPRRR